MCVSLMATNLVKWWRTKFLNGYKQFTVLPTDSSEGRPSDTEELIRGGGECGALHCGAAPGCGGVSDCSISPQVRERSSSMGHCRLAQGQCQGASRGAATPSERGHLKFEGFECDVSVERVAAPAGGSGGDTGADGGGGRVIGGGRGSAERPGPYGRQQRQEFSFTLYDFDGHGKITKDDITGLVTTIYETLGSTIRVPHYGSKTIRVKLTVSPDKRNAGGTSAAGQEDASPPPPTADASSHAPPTPGGATTTTTTTTTHHRVRFKRDLNVTIRERRRRVGGGGDGGREEDGGGGGGEVVIVEAEVEGVEEESEAAAASRGGQGGGESPARTPDVAYRKFGSRHHRCHEGDCCLGGLQEAPLPLLPLLRKSGGGGGGRRRRKEQRSGSLQRQELLQIIQANMEKNNLSFQTSNRKHCSQEGHQHRHHHSGSNEASPRAKHQSVHHRQQRPPHHHSHSHQQQQNPLPHDYADCGRSHYLDLAGYEPCSGSLGQEYITRDNSLRTTHHHHHHHHRQSSPNHQHHHQQPLAVNGKFASGGRGMGCTAGRGGNRGRSCPAPCPTNYRNAGGVPKSHGVAHHLRSRSHDLSRPFPYHFLERQAGEEWSGGGGEEEEGGGGGCMAGGDNEEEEEEEEEEGEEEERGEGGSRAEEEGGGQEVAEGPTAEPPATTRPGPHHSSPRGTGRHHRCVRRSARCLSPKGKGDPGKAQGPQARSSTTRQSSEGHHHHHHHHGVAAEPPVDSPLETALPTVPVAVVSAAASPHLMNMSPTAHHLKHRNREEDQARAMAQVVRWLEKGHFLAEAAAGKTGRGLGGEERVGRGGQAPLLATAAIPREGSAPEERVHQCSKRVQGRREYRHVHEHIHHHYHHYQETAIIV